MVWGLVGLRAGGSGLGGALQVFRLRRASLSTFAVMP